MKNKLVTMIAPSTHLGKILPFSRLYSIIKEKNRSEIAVFEKMTILKVTFPDMIAGSK